MSTKRLLREVNHGSSWKCRINGPRLDTQRASGLATTSFLEVSKEDFQRMASFKDRRLLR